MKRPAYGQHNWGWRHINGINTRAVVEHVAEATPAHRESTLEKVIDAIGSGIAMLLLGLIFGYAFACGF